VDPIGLHPPLYQLKNTHHHQTKHITQNYTDNEGHAKHNEYNADTIATTTNTITTTNNKNIFRQVDTFFTALAMLAVSIAFAPRSADLYLHSSLRLHDVVLN
jgi:hypothetical protein